MADTKDEKLIEVPKNYDDPILEHPHMVQKGESVVTCNMAITDIAAALKAGKATCGKCATTFDVRKAA